MSQKADVFIIVPASADVIGKVANEIADDMLTTMVLAAGFGTDTNKITIISKNDIQSLELMSKKDTAEKSSTV